jgi:membrane-anchored protein YejM (alkaline phosphatase superfamily)
LTLSSLFSATLPSIRQQNRYLLWSGLLLVLHVAAFATGEQFADLNAALWTVATTISYAVIYLLPAVVLIALGRTVLSRLPGQGAGFLLAVLAIVTTSLTHVLLFADRTIYAMYGFHINGFVLDLVKTPGGIDSLGASRSTELTAAAIILAFFLIQAALYLLVIRKEDAAPAIRWRWLVAILLCLTVGERVAYGFSHAANYPPILFAAERYPLYLPMTFRKLSASLGIDVASQGDEVKARKIDLSYPLQPLEIKPPAKPLNVVWLVAESLRFDMLDPKIMPALWQFSEQSLRMERHYSGGNMTQMGVFSMFYGLYGNYWFPMLSARRAPVLMDVMQQQDYQFGLYTSQRFTYPAFDKTVFVNIRPEDLHERAAGEVAWRRDQLNIDDLLSFVDQRDKRRPFMAYMFFESTHANYYFPDDAVIARPYIDDLNYLTADFAKEIGQIKNRYINAAHHVDSQIARVLEHLRKTGLLDQTIVIVLGDHGEEFMERSRWGHSAEFNRYQTSTPGVIYVPGQAPRVMTGISSHLDIPATLLPLLGVMNPPQDYSLGGNLLDPKFHRPYAVAADWNRIAYLGEHYKITIPFNATGSLRNEVTDGDDNPVADISAAKQAISQERAEIMTNLARFSKAKY